MRDAHPRRRRLFLEQLEIRVALSAASDLIADVTVPEDAASSVIDLGAVFEDPDLGLGGALTYAVTASVPIADVVAQVSQASYTTLLQDLLYTHTGDNRGLMGPEHDLARDNIAAYFTALGLETSLEPFQYSYTIPPLTCHNVVGVQRGVVRPDDVYIVGAHYDSAGNPGADDNASGTAAVMELARVLSQYSFEATLVFVAFDREEQGMIGSRAYVNSHATDRILGMLNLDMIAYNTPGAGHDTVQFFDVVTGGVVKPQLAAAFAAYGGGLTTVDSGRETASDHYWFEQRGFDAALVIEYGADNNPYYHSAGDAVETVDYLDYAYATRIACGTVGYLATAAGLQTTSTLLAATVAGGDLTLDYLPDAHGIAEICVRATNAQGLSIEDTFRVTVNPVADPPTLDPVDDLHVRRDAQDVVATLAGISSGDGTAQPVRVTAVSSAPTIVPNPEVWYFSPAEQGTVRFAQISGTAGTAVITVTVEDGGADDDLDTPGDNQFVSQEFSVEVLPEQHPPSATADEYATAEHETLTVSAPGVLSNDVDADGDALHVVLVTSTAHGVLQLQSNGSFTYTPDDQFNREDTFTYVASDGIDDSPCAAVQIIIHTAFPWHNGLDPRNVNDDGLITPIDALLIINALNRGEAGKLPLVRPRPLTLPFYDVNRDGYLSPIDGLQVINHLNQGGGEGEADAGATKAMAAKIWPVVIVKSEMPAGTRAESDAGQGAGGARAKDSRAAAVVRQSLDLLFAGLGKIHRAEERDSVAGRQGSDRNDLEELLDGWARGPTPASHLPCVLAAFK